MQKSDLFIKNRTFSAQIESLLLIGRYLLEGEGEQRRRRRRRSSDGGGGVAAGAEQKGRKKRSGVYAEEERGGSGVIFFFETNTLFFCLKRLEDLSRLWPMSVPRRARADLFVSAGF